MLQVGPDHGSKLLTSYVEDGGIKQLGWSSNRRGDVDSGAGSACQKGDREFGKLGQPQRAYLAAAMQCDQLVGHHLVVDADLWPAHSLAGVLGGEVGQEDQRARVSVGVAGQSVEQLLCVGLGNSGW